MTRRFRLTASLVAASLLLVGCSSKPDSDPDALAAALVDIADLTTEEAQCVADDITENADYSEFYVEDDGSPQEDPPSMDDVFDDLGDGKSDVEGLVEAFEQDVADAVTTCADLG